MNLVKKFSALFLAFFIYFQGISQELNCQVIVLTDLKAVVSTVDQEIIDQMKQTIYELMNNTAWTKDKFKTEERINCTMQFQINSIPQTGTFMGTLQVQSTRPSYNGSYNTTVFNFQDVDLTVGFSRNAVLAYAPNQYRDNLTSICAFYAYFILGMDYDSFSLKGGTPYFNEAQNIVSLAQNSGAPGWKSGEQGKRNRYWLVDNVLQQLFDPLRECFYEYHRNGIDKLYENKEVGRKAIFDALSKLSTVVSVRPNSINLLSFVQCKTIEIKNLFEDAEVKEKTEVVNLLKRIDPSNSSKYQEILD
jgi:hypothetical protein